MEPTNFWINDISILFNRNRFTNIIPISNNTNQNLNALTRLFILFFIILFATQTFDKLYVPLLGIIIIIFYYFYNKQILITNNNDNDRIPTFKNPFMNPTINEYNTVPEKVMNYRHFTNDKEYQPYDNEINYERLDQMQITETDEESNEIVAANSDDDDIQDKIKYRFTQDMYDDYDDVYDRKNSQRQFYTVHHNIPNDQQAFANWTYNTPPTCKEDQSRCLRYQDYRLKYS
jgi:hypothetical protein